MGRVTFKPISAARAQTIQHLLYIVVLSVPMDYSPVQNA